MSKDEVSTAGGHIPPTPLERYVALYDEQLRQDMRGEFKRLGSLTHDALSALRKEVESLKQQVATARSDTGTQQAQFEQLRVEDELRYQTRFNNLWWGVALGLFASFSSLGLILAVMARLYR